MNHDAFEKFIHRQEFARVLKKEQELYQLQLNNGTKIRSDKEIDDQKRLLLKEIALPSNEDFTRIENYITDNSKSRRQNIRMEYDEDKSLQDISNFIDRVFTPSDQFQNIQNQDLDENKDDSLDVIQEQLFEETSNSFPNRSNEQRETANFGDDQEVPMSENSSSNYVSDDFLPNKVQRLDQINIKNDSSDYNVDFFKNEVQQLYSDRQFKEARNQLKNMLYSIEF